MTVSWKFLHDTLIFFNLNASWVNLIMSCVSNVKTSILWNGESLSEFSPSRGLRQGDPLSPYLFVLCMERLSILINSKSENGSWKDIRASKTSCPLTHLFFANDLMLFGQANLSTCRTIMDVLNTFCDMSGQTISLAKSKLFVSPNVRRRKARRFRDFCGIPLTNDLGKYLGVPLFHKRVSKNHFNQLIEKMKRKLCGWKSNTLRLSGRATLAQSVTTTIPSYIIQTMKLPASVCVKLDRLNRNFIWATPLTRKNCTWLIGKKCVKAKIVVVWALNLLESRIWPFLLNWGGK